MCRNPVGLGAKRTRGFMKASLSRGKIQAGTLFGATNVDPAIAHSGRAPTFTLDGFGPAEFFVTIRSRCHRDHLAVIAQGDEDISGQNDVARSKPGLLPF